MAMKKMKIDKMLTQNLKNSRPKFQKWKKDSKSWKMATKSCKNDYENASKASKL